eukprot:maker-scaffold_6-snap-gene-8.6-mRNA-1 protein AED:0.01 eAED:0.01 QI:67/1/1/1/1/1/3/14/391
MKILSRYLFLLPGMIQSSMHSRMSSKTSYNYRTTISHSYNSYSQCSDLKGFENCHLESVYAIIRHGTRFPTKGSRKRMNSNNLAHELLEENDGELMQRGRDELFALGERFKKKYDSLKDIHLQSSSRKRVVESAEFFKKGFFKTDLNGLEEKESTGLKTDPLLRYHSTCSKYRKNVKSKDSYLKRKVREVEQFFQDKILSLFRKFKKDTKSVDEVKALYEYCQYIHTLDNGDLNHCQVFSKSPDLLEILEYLYDAQSWFLKGGGDELNTNMSCRLQNEISKNLNQNLLTLRFAHAETIIPIVTLLNNLEDSKLRFFEDIPKFNEEKFDWKNRTWKLSSLVPYGANLVFEKYSCGYQIYLNEDLVFVGDETSLDSLMQSFSSECNFETLCKV